MINTTHPLRLVPDATSASPVDGDLETYLQWGRELRGFSEATLKHRAWVLGRVLRTSGVPLRQVTEAHLLNWERLDVAGRAPESRRAYISHVTTFYRWLVQTKVIVENPAAGLTRPKLPRPVPNPIREDDLRRAIAAASPKLAAMLVLGAYAGLRSMEIAQLHWQDVVTTPDGRTVLRVRHGKGDKGRTVPVGQVVMEALRRHGARARGPVFLGRDGQQIKANSVSCIINDHLHRCGIDATAHKLRHRFATVSAGMVDNDLPLIAKLCGWNSLETAKHYVLPDPERANKLVTALDKLAGVETA
jgi:integrase